MADKSDPRLACARQIGAVVLDYGEVLCSRPSPDALASMAGMFGIDAGKFLAIYRHTLAQLDAPQTEVLFVDDREENIQAARALGICGILFESVAQFRKDLEELGFPILPVSGSAGQRSPE